MTTMKRILNTLALAVIITSMMPSFSWASADHMRKPHEVFVVYGTKNTINWRATTRLDAVFLDNASEPLIRTSLLNQHHLAEPTMN